ncbi:hypothetical protein H5410_003238 [Solanum commersonii]|uniref:G-patch domain-containing protein n=1 Tax=Solanum commersonii TaxID=4109 RepID=A0A9J6B493_SOLCO|nr:hypothetical protein H5410_003238 [Solanum commersonii]
MTDKDDFNAAANIMIPIESPEGSRNMIDIQNGEKMAHMEQELEILREELRQVRDLAKLSATTFPTFKTPIYFAKSDFPNQPEQTQHAPTHGQVPPASPTAVRTAPDLSNRDPTIPTMQQILGAHVAAPYEPHVPPVYAARAPTFAMPAVSMVALQAASRAIQSGSIGGIKKKREDVSAVTYQPGGPSHRYPNNPQIAAHTSYVPHQFTKIDQHMHRDHVQTLKLEMLATYTPIAEPYTQLFERLRAAGVLQPVEGKLPDPIPRNFDGSKRCAYHSGVQGHDTEDCYGLKNQIESLIRRGVIKCTPAPPNVNNNPLPNHENREVNMEPLTVQTYLPRVVVTTLVAKRLEYDTKAVPWDYRAITNELDGAAFHTLEIMQAIRVNEGAEPEDTKLSSAAKMVASEMLKYGYQPKNGLGPKSDGIVEPIHLKHQRGTNGLGYEPASGRDRHGSNDIIFVPEQSSIPDQASIDDITKE